MSTHAGFFTSPAFTACNSSKSGILSHNQSWNLLDGSDDVSAKKLLLA